MTAIEKAKLNTLKKFVQELGGIPDDQWENLAKVCFFRKYKRRDTILQADTYDSVVGYILSGMTKRSFLHENGKEFVHYFATTGRFVGAYSSILQREKAKVQITAIEDTEVICFDFKDYENLYKQHRCWDRFTRKVTELLFIDRENREYQLLMLSAKERYQSFLQDFGQFAPRLTKQEIASYLGITPEAFSRLQKTL